MNDNKIKLARDTIRALLDVMAKPVTESTHIERVEVMEAGEIVYRSLDKKGTSNEKSIFSNSVHGDTGTARATVHKSQ